MVRGDIPIEPGYSWFTTKTILVVLFIKLIRISIYAIAPASTGVYDIITYGTAPLPVLPSCLLLFISNMKRNIFIIVIIIIADSIIV